MDHWGVTEVGEKRRGIRVGLLKTKALNLRECGDQECTERYSGPLRAEVMVKNHRWACEWSALVILRIFLDFIRTYNLFGLSSKFSSILPRKSRQDTK